MGRGARPAGPPSHRRLGRGLRPGTDHHAPRAHGPRDRRPLLSRSPGRDGSRQARASGVRVRRLHVGARAARQLLLRAVLELHPAPASHRHPAAGGRPGGRRGPAGRRSQRDLPPRPPQGLAPGGRRGYAVSDAVGGGTRVNPLFVVPLLAYTLAATLSPGQVDGRRRGRALLFGEALFVIAALVLGKLLAPLARPSADGLWWGRVGLLATAYLYVSGRGIVLIRSVLELPTLQMRRDEDRTAGASDVARGRAVGSLERAPARPTVLRGRRRGVG